jgi:hypothetical protein
MLPNPADKSTLELRLVGFAIHIGIRCQFLNRLADCLRRGLAGMGLPNDTVMG